MLQKIDNGIYIMWAAGTLAMGNQISVLEDRIGSRTTKPVTVMSQSVNC